MMKAHNRALDFVTLALSQGRKGNIERSAALLQAALEEPDCVTAIRILEASNKQALLHAQAQASAAAKPAAKAAAAKPTAAKKAPVKAELEDEGMDEIDDGLDDDSMEALVGDEGDGDAEDDEEVIEASDEDESDEDEEDEEDSDETFAKLLAAMRKKSSAPAAKAKK